PPSDGNPGWRYRKGGAGLREKNVKKFVMNRLRFLLFLFVLSISGAVAQYKPATVTESTKAFPTYAYSDPNPIPEVGRIYPYFRFDGYQHKPEQKVWKTVELENEFIK